MWHCGPLEWELMGRFTFRTRGKARLAVFDVIGAFYKRERRHSSLGYIGPEAFACAARIGRRCIHPISSRPERRPKKVNCPTKRVRPKFTTVLW